MMSSTPRAVQQGCFLQGPGWQALGIPSFCSLVVLCDMCVRVSARVNPAHSAAAVVGARVWVVRGLQGVSCAAGMNRHVVETLGRVCVVVGC